MIKLTEDEVNQIWHNTKGFPSEQTTRNFVENLQNAWELKNKEFLAAQKALVEKLKQENDKFNDVILQTEAFLQFLWRDVPMNEHSFEMLENAIEYLTKAKKS